MTRTRKNAYLSQTINVDALAVGDTLFIPGSGFVNISGVITANGGDSNKWNNAYDIAVYASGAGLSEDDSPSLSSNLDINSNNIIGSGNINVTGIISNSEIQISNNVITSLESNADLILAPNGSGSLLVSSSGNNRGSYSVDLQLNKSGSDRVALGDFSFIGAGSNNMASGDYSAIIGGMSAKTSLYGEISHSAGSFSSIGDAQSSQLIVRNTTTDATENVVLYLDGSSQEISIPPESTSVFNINLVAYNDTDSASAWANFRGGIKRDDSDNTSIVGSIIKEYDYDVSMSGALSSVVANDTNETLEIRVTGLESKNIRWTACVNLMRVNW